MAGKPTYQELEQKVKQLEKSALVQKRSEKELRKSLKLYRLISEGTSDLIAITTFSLKPVYTYVSPSHKAIMGFEATELIADKHCGNLNPTQEEYLKDVLQSGNHLLALINDVLEISKIEAGKLTLELSEVNIRTLLANSPTMIKAKALQRGIKLSTDFDKVPAMIKTDGRRLNQILYNLLSNAVRFTPAGGEISLNASRLKNSELSVRDLGRSGGKFIKISVKDTGTGLKSDDLERVFYPFEQAENSANCDCQGTGLGLSLSKSLVEQLGGRIWAESEGEGKGITFSFIVPC